jgi:hypothetical protein
MTVILIIALGICLAIILGQFFAGTADYYLSIDNPRPLDDNLVRITIKGWGFASEADRRVVAEIAGEGIADVRLFATRTQMLVSLVSLGFLRPVSIAWRGNAGQHPLGVA